MIVCFGNVDSLIRVRGELEKRVIGISAFLIIVGVFEVNMVGFLTVCGVFEYDNFCISGCKCVVWILLRNVWF